MKIQYELQSSKYCSFTGRMADIEVEKDRIKARIRKQIDHLSTEEISLYSEELDKAFSTNVDLDYIKSDVNQYKLETILSSSKPLCIYATSLESDHNGAIHSRKSILEFDSIIAPEIEKVFTIHKITFDGRKDLNKQLKNIGQLKDVSLLILDGHGCSTEFSGMSTSYFSSAKLNISSDTQIVLFACETAGGEDPKKSIAYKIAKDSQCEVFAARESISHMGLCVDKTTKKVTKVNFARGQEPIDSYRFYIEKRRETESQSLTM